MDPDPYLCYLSLFGFPPVVIVIIWRYLLLFGFPPVVICRYLSLFEFPSVVIWWYLSLFEFPPVGGFELWIKICSWYLTPKYSDTERGASGTLYARCQFYMLSDTAANRRNSTNMVGIGSDRVGMG